MIAFVLASADGCRLAYTAQGVLVRALPPNLDRAAIGALLPGIEVIDVDAVVLDVAEIDVPGTARRPAGWKNRLHALGYSDAARDAMSAAEVCGVIASGLRAVSP